jgi:hypothetical protein
VQNCLQVSHAEVCLWRLSKLLAFEGFLSAVELP